MSRYQNFILFLRNCRRSPHWSTFTPFFAVNLILNNSERFVLHFIVFFLNEKEILNTWQQQESTVQPLLNGHPRGNGYWPLNRGKNNRKALTGTLTIGRPILLRGGRPFNRGSTVLQLMFLCIISSRGKKFKRPFICGNFFFADRGKTAKIAKSDSNP